MRRRATRLSPFHRLNRLELHPPDLTSRFSARRTRGGVIGMTPTQDSAWRSLASDEHCNLTRQLQDLAGRLERSIELKAQGRIRGLRVLCLEDAIVLEGSARTYHAKQLAQEAVLSVTEGRFSLSNQIIVA
jgi:hypothetical protein